MPPKIIIENIEYFLYMYLEALSIHNSQKAIFSAV